MSEMVKQAAERVHYLRERVRWLAMCNTSIGPSERRVLTLQFAQAIADLNQAECDLAAAQRPAPPDQATS